jgi:hypothetical protein
LLRSLSRNHLGAEGAAALAPALAANGGLTALDLSSNDLKDEGVSAVCEAIQSNKETKLASFNVKKNGIGPVGANTVAAMVAVAGALTSIDLSGNDLTHYGRDMTGIKELAAALGVTGSLTECNVRGNFLDSESAKKLAKIGNEKGIMLFGIKRDQKEANFAKKGLSPADAILISSDLVIGGLTSLDLSNNSLCGVNDTYGGTYTAEGITAIADALCVNGGLTRVDVNQNNMAGGGAVQLAAAVLGNFKIEIFNEIPIKEMRANSITELDLNGKDFGVEGVMVVAGLIPVMGALTTVWTSAHDSLSSQY